MILQVLLLKRDLKLVTANQYNHRAVDAVFDRPMVVDYVWFYFRFLLKKPTILSKGILSSRS